MGITNSPQEELLKRIAEHSLAAPFVFAPDNQTYKDREPADLVWACNNCVILMWMQEAKGQSDHARRIRKRREAIDHNLSQARKWMKKWKSGCELRGSNGFHNFLLLFDPNIHVIVLSVIKCDEAVAEFHDEQAKKMGVRACLTMPQSAIEDLAAGGGTTLDLLLIMDYLRERWGAGIIPESNVLDLVYSYGVAMCRAVGVYQVWPDGRIDDTLHQATYPFLAARRQKSREDYANRPNDCVGMSSLRDVFNDINIGEFLHLALTAREGMQRSQSSRELAHCSIPLNTYDFNLYFGRGISEENLREIGHDFSSFQAQQPVGQSRYGPLLIMDTHSRLFHILLDQRNGPSQTELLLNKWAVR